MVKILQIRSSFVLIQRLLLSSFHFFQAEELCSALSAGMTDNSCHWNFEIF